MEEKIDSVFNISENCYSAVKSNAMLSEQKVSHVGWTKNFQINKENFKATGGCFRIECVIKC